MAGEGTVLAAVSGGSDSSALLLLLRDHLRANAPDTLLLAVSIDHGLRTGSGGEAERVATFAQSLGVAHRTLRWDGPKPRAGLPAAARAARYRLLLQAAEDAGARLVFTGHTADDQAETVAMRLSRGEGRGTAGMAALTLFAGRLWIARPLLEVRRAALRNLLRERGVGWIEDPTNADTRFERARLRQTLRDGSGASFSGGQPGPARPSRSEEQGPRPPASGLPETEDLLCRARETGEARRQTAMRAAALLATHADQPAPGLFRLQPDFLERGSRPVATEALRFLVATVGGRSFPVDAARAGTLLDELRGTGKRTIGGVVVERRSDAVFLFRENRGIAEAGSGGVFDNRFRLSAFREPGSVGPWGGDGDAGWPFPSDVPRPLLRAAFAASPVFRPFGGGRPLPLEAAGIGRTALVAPFREFLPGFDLPLAQALAQLAGAPAFPLVPGTRLQERGT